MAFVINDRVQETTTTTGTGTMTAYINQGLYEEGLITYMRTDMAILSEEAIQEGKQWIQAQYGEEYLQVTNPNKKPKVKPEAKPEAKLKANEEVKAQEA
jgi:DNA topoisomerase IA